MNMHAQSTLGETTVPSTLTEVTVGTTTYRVTNARDLRVGDLITPLPRRPESREELEHQACRSLLSFGAAELRWDERAAAIRDDIDAKIPGHDHWALVRLVS